MVSEDLMAYQIGQRNQLSERWAVEVAAYFNDHDELRTLEAGTPFEAVRDQAVRIRESLLGGPPHPS